MRYTTIKRCHECGRLYDGDECPECGYYAQDYAEPEGFDKDDSKEEDDDETVQHI
jgi:rRNA maturation endonuclease Nob1